MHVIRKLLICNYCAVSKFLDCMKIFIGIAPAILVKHYKPKISVTLRGANLCIHFAGRLVRESADRLNECALRFANHNLLTKSQYLGPVHMIPGQLIAPEQLTDPGINFASAHSLTPVTVHMSFSLPRGTFERRATRCTTPGNPPCRGNFSPCEQNAKAAPGMARGL